MHKKVAPPVSSHGVPFPPPQSSPTLFGLIFILFAVLLGSLLGRWAAAVFTTLAILLVLSNLKLSTAEKDRIRFEVYSIPDIHTVVLHALAAFNENETNADSKREFKTILLTALSTMAKKYNTEMTRQQQKQSKGNSTAIANTSSSPDTTELALCCQEVACIGIEYFGNNDEDDIDDGNVDEINTVLTASIALLALVAGVDAVRQRHVKALPKNKKKSNSLYGLQKAFRALEQALVRAKKTQQPKQEQEAAELQRKGCLWIGALADNDAAMAEHVVNHGGLPILINTISWYRFHKEVVNWGLWAMFVLCYESPVNKIALQNTANGISAIVTALKCCATESQEVARHGVAILFDLLRQHQISGSFDVIRVRDAALVAGLHDALVPILEEHCSSMDIMMMGRELLIATGYQGNVPEFSPQK